MELCSIENLKSAFKNARKGKGKKRNVVKFEDNPKEELQSLRSELLLKSYSPKPLCTFIVRDPKTRKINASAFRDRVIHHAVCNVIEPIFDRAFIYDSYANRKRKGAIGSILTGLFGYNGDPSLIEVIAYIAYLVFIIFLWKNINKVHRVI